MNQFYNFQNIQTKMIGEDYNIEMFRLKKLFSRLQQANISGSVITLVIPPKKSIVDYTKALKEQKAMAANIKDKNNRNSVIEALGSAYQRLRCYGTVPNNGLVLFCGNILEMNSKTERKFICDFEPYKPINFKIFSIANRFQLDKLKKELLVSEPSFGFIVVDGEGALFATLQGNSKQILTTIKVELSNSHNKGGQSQLRFSRLHKQSRHNYLRKVCEVATKCFVTQNKCNVVGLVLAGSADLKSELYNSQMFDPRLKTKVLKVIDIGQGLETGLNIAIQKSAQLLKNTKYVQQTRLIGQYFDHIAKADNMVVSGIQQTMRYMETGAIKKLICLENLDILRIPVRNSETGELTSIYSKPENFGNPQIYMDGDVRLYRIENEEEQLLVQWIAEHYKDFGCQIEFVSDKSAEGTQFTRNFGGLGGFLRYKIELEDYQTEFMEDEAEQFI